MKNIVRKVLAVVGALVIFTGCAAVSEIKSELPEDNTRIIVSDELASETKLTEKDAIDAVLLSVEGASENEVTINRSGEDTVTVNNDDSSYTGSLVHEDTEYSFAVDKETGRIVEWNSGNAKAEDIKVSVTEADAKKIALGQVKGAKESDIKWFRFDRDDSEYEGEIIFNGKKYEFEIDANTGNISDWEVESASATDGSTQDLSAYITIEEAKKIAIAKVKGAGYADVTKIRLDKEDGVYDGEIVYEGKEYDFEINAATGKIVEWEVEKVREELNTDSNLITSEEAVKIALSQVKGAKDSDVKEIKFDKEDGVYEGEIVFNGREYDFEIDAKTGKITEWEVE